MDINDKEKPKLVCAGNNPQKIQIYGAVLSLYVNRLVKLVNKKGGMKSSLVFDEFPTIYLNNMDGLIATARSNKVATTMGIQDFSQLRKDYGEKQAKVILSMVGNIISGQVTGDSDKQLSERFGKIMQDRQSLTINSSDTSVSKSRQLDYAIPQSTIASLSAGEVVGVVADNPDQRIAQKMFHGQVQHDFDALKKEEAGYKALPRTDVDEEGIKKSFLRIKLEVKAIVGQEMERIVNNVG